MEGMFAVRVYLGLLCDRIVAEISGRLVATPTANVACMGFIP